MFGDLKANTLFTMLKTWLRGELVGEDQHGNRYYRQRGARTRDWRKERRWVVYAKEAEPSLVPPGWVGWLHRRIEIPPSERPLPTPSWQTERVPSATGPELTYRSPGAIRPGGRRARASGDYEAWHP